MASKEQTPQIPHSHKPYGSDGSGFYSDNTLGCFNVFQEMVGLLHQVIDQYKEVKDIFSIADYGTADGGTSMLALKSTINRIREKSGEKVAVLINYEDQPTNDFKSLFLRLQGLIPGPPSYFLSEKNVFITACGTGFYSQCFPPEFVDLGMSSTSMHWLSKKPCTITGALHHTMITNDAERKAFAAQAAKDWETILLQRSKEMKHGAALVLAQFAIDAEGQSLGKTHTIQQSMHQVMRDLWKAMAEEGKITEDEFQETTFINYYRTVEEFSAPFSAPELPVYKSGLRLKSIETKVVRCPYHEKWLAKGGDPVAHARWIITTFRTWSNHTFYSGLSAERSEEERKGLVDELFKRYEDQIAKNPSEHGMDFVHAYILIEKV